MVISGMVQPGSTAKERAIGNEAAMKGPRYGMNRSSAASRPHSTGFGTPIRKRPTPIGNP